MTSAHTTTGRPLRERVIALIDRGVSLPPLSPAAAQLIRILPQPIDRIDMRKLVELVQEDPTLSAHVLRLANSPFWGIRQSVSTVGLAVSLIGLQEVVGTLNYHLLRQLTPNVKRSAHFSPDAFWLHSWRGATAARLLGRPDLFVTCLPGQLYMAGLLHDIGKLILVLHFGEEWEACADEAATSGRPLHEVEQERMGVDHAEVGARQLEVWGLPDLIRFAVDWHHRPGELPEGPAREMASLIQFANAIAHACTAHEVGTVPVCPISETWLGMHKDHPLSDPVKREGIVHEVMAALLARERHLDDGEATNAAEEEPARPAPIAAPRPVELAPARPRVTRVGAAWRGGAHWLTRLRRLLLWS
ncbi:MAG TPA: HDOD domain-containing protein [Candidatus Sumerlaeota bacterium]|nr:HDOD domain-containing protein [Candidatus Sumerlaeota bacterium]HOR27764.1 HDOD domain-containing protein [Candidatus Sumerlaeota bacterium]